MMARLIDEALQALLRVTSILGTPSIPLLVLLAELPMRRFAHRSFFSTGERRTLLGAVLAVAVVLYASTLGYFQPDIYRFGFSPWAPVVLATLAIVAARRSFPLACTALVVLVGFDVELFGSLNLFDYVVDPIVGLIALGWLIALAVRALTARVFRRA